MRALVFDGTVHVRDDLPEPVRTPGEALVRMRLSGVCDTDLQIIQGYMGFRGVLGHEFVGEVIDADDPSWIGKRVVADINAGCGACEDCRSRNGHHCQSRTVLGIVGRAGAIAERLLLPERNLVAVDASIPDAAAVFAEPLAAALHVLDELGDSPRAPLAVVGDGKLGLLIALVLCASGIAVTVFGRHADKLAIARRAGATTDDGTGEPAGRGAFEVVVDASGTRSGLQRAMELAAPRGLIVLKTTVSGAHDVDLSPIVINELRVVGSRCGDLGRAIRTLAAGSVDPTALIEASYPLRLADQAASHAARRGAKKVLVENDVPASPVRVANSV